MNGLLCQIAGSPRNNAGGMKGVGVEIASRTAAYTMPGMNYIDRRFITCFHNAAEIVLQIPSSDINSGTSLSSAHVHVMRMH